MTVESVKTGADPEVLKVGLSDGSFFSIRVSYAASETLQSLCPGLVLSDEQLVVLRSASDTFAVERAALRLVSLREHSRFLLGQKLRGRGFPEPSIGLVLDRLTLLGLVDDTRFASLWVESRLSSKNEGRVKLLGGLLSRGVARDVAEEVLRRRVDEETELAGARRLLEKMKRTVLVSDDAVRKKLMAAGYSSKIIRAAFQLKQ